MKTRKGYLVKRGKIYYAMWTVGGKKFQQTTGCTDIDKARPELYRIMAPHLIENEKHHLETVKAFIESKKHDLAAIDEVRNPNLTITKAWDAYLESDKRPDTGESTLAQYAFQFTRFETWIADKHSAVKTLKDVTPEIASAFAASMTKDGMSGNTVNKYLNLLTLVFRVLKKPARLTVNPWEDIQRKRVVSQGRRELTIGELRDVCAAAQGEMRIMLAIGIYTGLRLGDCATLRWGEVDLIRGSITRIPNKTGRRNPKPVLIPIHPTLGAMLAEIPTKARKGYLLPEIAADYLSRSDNITDKVQKLFTDCKILTHKPGTGYEIKVHEDGTRERIDTGKRAVVEVGFHSLRHSFVSLCRAANTPLSVVESIVGHSTPAMTRHYTHTGEAAALAAVSALPSIMGEPKALPPAQSSRLVDAGAVRSIVDGLNGKNWKVKREKLLTLLDTITDSVIMRAQT